MILSILNGANFIITMDAERQNLVDFIKKTIPMSDSEAKDIANHFVRVSLKKNDFLLSEGAICSEYTFLERGFIRAYTFDTEGKEVTTNFYRQNSMVFEVASYIKRKPSSENFQALTDCLCWKGNYPNLQTLFQTNQAYREFARIILVNGFIALKERTLSMINLTAEKRYEMLLKDNHEIMQYASIKHIASYLGITDTSLSRIRKEISRK